MIARRVTINDWSEILRLSKNQDYEMGDFKYFASGCVIEDTKKKIIGFAYFTRCLEASIMLDLDQPIITQARTLLMLQEVAKAEAEILEFDRFYAFVKDSSFAELLKKHFKAKTAHGEALFIKLDDTNG